MFKTKERFKYQNQVQVRLTSRLKRQLGLGQIDGNMSEFLTEIGKNKTKSKFSNKRNNVGHF